MTSRIQTILSEARQACGENLQAQLAYLAGWIHGMEISGINRTMNQSTRDIQIKGEKTIEGEGVSIMNIEQPAE